MLLLGFIKKNVIGDFSLALDLFIPKVVSRSFGPPIIKQALGLIKHFSVF